MPKPVSTDLANWRSVDTVLTPRPGRQIREVAAVTVAAGLALAIVLLGPDPTLVAMGFGLALCLAAFSSVLLSWRALLVTLCVVIVLVPARRYSLPVDLPYRLEPYRLVLMVILAGILASLLVDRRFHLHRLGFGGVIAALLGISLLSVAANVPRIVQENLSSTVLGGFLQLLTLAAVFLVVRQIANSRRDVHMALGALVACGAIAALAAAYERQTQVNLFRSFDSFTPFTEVAGGGEPTLRGQGVRALSSFQHPIALGAEMVLLLPIGVYLSRHSGWPRSPGTRRALWGTLSALLLLGMVASVSRTTIVMLAAIALVAVALRPRALTASLPFIVPLVVAMLLVVPSALSDLVSSLNPQKGLVEEQRQTAGGRGSGRVADLGPAMEEIAARPFFGRGFGTRVTNELWRGHTIYDNNYLTTAVDVGLPGLFAALTLMLAPVRRMWRLARLHMRVGDSSRADLAAALAASFAANAVSLFFYDGFVQPLLTFMILLAVAGWLLVDRPVWLPTPLRATVAPVPAARGVLRRRAITPHPL